MTHRLPTLPVALVLFSLVAAAPPAAAQGRGTVAGQVGVTFQSETAAVFGGEFGVAVAPMVHIYGAVGRMQDALPNDIQDVIDLIDDRVDLSLPTFYAMGGVRAVMPSGPARPYVVFGAGLAHVGLTAEFNGIDITDDVEDAIDEDLTTNEFAFELGGGLMIPVGARGFVDAGYRYTRINGADINVSRVYGGFGVRF
jgi:Outer membrane protein beta-barrel domain